MACFSSIKGLAFIFSILTTMLLICVFAAFALAAVRPEECPKWNVFLNLVTGKRGEKCCPNVAFHNSSQICYSNKAGSTWENVNQLPDCGTELQPEFFVYTPETAVNGAERNQSFSYFDLTRGIEDLVVQKNRQFVIIIHGYHTKFRENNWMVVMKDALIPLGHNVMIVKWVKGSNIKSYIKAAANTRSVGTAILNVVLGLLDSGKVSLQSLTLIGFSLGAHISGYVGSRIPGLPRILAMDPAGPLFACGNLGMRLDPSDAQFVQVLHTNGETFLKGGMGTNEQLGHVDFYANGGLRQPFCGSAVAKMARKIVKFDFSSMKDISCSHGFAPKIVTEMIQRLGKNKETDPADQCSFEAFSCENAENWKHGKCFGCHEELDGKCPELGLAFSQAPQPKIYKNKFYFNTIRSSNETGKFCGRQWLVTMMSNKRAKGEIFVQIIDKNGHSSNQLLFHKEYYILKKNEPSSKVLVSPWQVSNVDKVNITYSKYSSVIWFDGPDKFDLVDVTLQSASGQKFKSTCPVTLVDKVRQTVNLMPYD